MSYVEKAGMLVEGLGLATEPVGVSLVRRGEEMPQWCSEVAEPVRHCQSVMRARRGESMTVPREKQMCGIGAAALGMSELGDDVASGEFHTKIGLYGKNGAAKASLELSPSLEAGSIVGTVVAPLRDFQGRPDVVIVTGTPEQIYWLLPVASTYDSGGRTHLDMASVQAACGDATAKPHITGECNISLGCFGCRKSTDMEPEEMMLGIPEPAFSTMMEAVKDLAEGPIPKSRNKG